MPAPPARMRSASVPCGTSSSSIAPARYFSVKARGSDVRGNEQTIFRTMPWSIMAAMPTRPVPALLLMTVRPFGLPVARKRSISAWINSTGEPEPPNPPIITVASSGMSAIASASVGTLLSIVSSGGFAPSLPCSPRRRRPARLYVVLRLCARRVRFTNAPLLANPDRAACSTASELEPARARRRVSPWAPRASRRRRWPKTFI